MVLVLIMIEGHTMSINNVLGNTVEESIMRPTLLLVVLLILFPMKKILSQ